MPLNIANNALPAAAVRGLADFTFAFRFRFNSSNHCPYQDAPY
jgi:hypothetical protein